MFSLLASLVINILTTPIQLASNACAGLEVNESAFDEGGVCIYSLGNYGWYYIKGGKSYGATCTLSDKWCNGFPTKEDAIKAAKSN